MEYDFIYNENSIYVSKTMENYEWIINSFKEKPDCRLTLFHVFNVHKDDVEIDSESYPTIVTVRIGSFNNGIYKIDGKVLNSDHSLYIRPGNEIQDLRWFVTSNHVKVMKTILETIGSDVTIGDEDEDLSYSTLESVINKFPTRTEIRYYTQTRISTILKEDLQISKDYEIAYQRYIDKKRGMTVKGLIDINEYDMAKFSYLEKQMVHMLNHPNDYDETTWQVKIKDILCVLFPQYILASREKELTEVFGHQKRVDFLLVNSSGYIDIMEIKRPEVPLLKKGLNHNNIVPSVAFSDCVMQIETYLYSLLMCNGDRVSKITEQILEKDGVDLQLRILNPRGLIIMGYFNGEMSDYQKHAIELIRRQYSHITDIITYDDMLERLRNTIRLMSGNIKRESTNNTHITHP